VSGAVGARPTDADTPVALTRHLAAWLGRWPPAAGQLEVVGAPVREEPGWDGTVRPLLGVIAPDRGVMSVRDGDAHDVDRLTRTAARRRGSPLAVVDQAGWRRDVAAAVGRDDHVVGVGVLRWTTEVVGPDELPDAGAWVDPVAPEVPAWLRPFNAPRVLVAADAGGEHLAGVGIKLHDRWGAEVAVVTTEAARGRGLARRLVAQAARRLLAGGRVVTYLHDPTNVASARVADAVGFMDRGWRVLDLFPQDAA
jgi:GNAT superfamily N-acetyltransferase